MSTDARSTDDSRAGGQGDALGGLFRKKPVTIYAMQFDGTNRDRIEAFYGDRLRKMGEALIIPTLEGEHRANVGDWIIRGVKGEFYPCKPDIFALTYEPASEATAAALRALRASAAPSDTTVEICDDCREPVNTLSSCKRAHYDGAPSDTPASAAPSVSGGEAIVALRAIAGQCANYTRGDCWGVGRVVGAPDSADAVCDQCIANRALSGVPAATQPASTGMDALDTREIAKLAATVQCVLVSQYEWARYLQSLGIPEDQWQEDSRAALATQPASTGMDRLHEILTYISEGRGPFKQDNHAFAESVIESAKEQATEGLGLLAALRTPSSSPGQNAIEVMRAALEPFAKAAENYGGIWQDDLPIERSYSDDTLPGLIGRARHLNIGDLRRANRAIHEGASPAPGEERK